MKQKVWLAGCLVLVLYAQTVAAAAEKGKEAAVPLKEPQLQEQSEPERSGREDRYTVFVPAQQVDADTVIDFPADI